jgi:hypothetical protein
MPALLGFGRNNDIRRIVEKTFCGRSTPKWRPFDGGDQSHDYWREERTQIATRGSGSVDKVWVNGSHLQANIFPSRRDRH